MSKTVIIPECMNPFEVMIDGKYYSYPAGTTQVVPDDVAAVIESHKQVHEAQMTPPSADLPGVCLPVVELSAETLTALFSGQQVMATEKEAAVFMAARDNITPLVVRGNFSGAGFASVGAFVTDSSSGAQIFDTNIASNRLIAMFVDGGVQLHIQ